MPNKPDRDWRASGGPTSESEAHAVDYARFNLIGESPAFRNAMRTVERLAACEATVLVQGETGTGKELAARAIHYLGKRRDAPFVPVNCGAIPESLVESELFGHARGAFTDAREPHAGLVTQAHGGTLFLDEIETLSGRAQVALLRFLQEHEYRPVGGHLVRGANVRVVSAANADLVALVDTGRFRADLLFRLQVLTVDMPPLRDRGSDVLQLAQTFVQRFCRDYGKPLRPLAPGVADWLLAQRWPGNVRELENLVHRAVVLSDDRSIDLRPTHVHDAPAEDGSSLTDRGFREAKADAIATFERAYIVELLARAQGNLSLAARLAGKERSRLGRLLKKYGVERDAFTRR